MQATLPVRFGGLGVSRAVQLAPSAYLSSSAATADLVSAILPTTHQSLLVDAALQRWSYGHSEFPPIGADVVREKYWKEIRAANAAETLLDGTTDEVERARLLAAMNNVSGAWLHALPISSVGFRMDDSTLRIAVGLRLNTAICAPHICQLCGAEVTELGTHGFSCRASEGRHLRHSTVNNILQRTLSAAGVPSRLEPPGFLRSDGKRPDGMTLVPWSSGRLLVWDDTCPDTYVVSYRGQATIEARCVAAHAGERKSGKYLHLSATYLFQPVAIESSGAFSSRTYIFLWEMGKRVFQESGEANSTSYLYSRDSLSIAVQQGNAVADMGCAGPRWPM